MHIFVSYSRVDRAFAEKFVARLRRMFPNDTVWYDDELHGGEQWWDAILDQIAKCQIFIYLLSNDSVTSPYCQAEFAEAQRLQKQVITVQARDRTKLTETLSDIQYVDMKRGSDDPDAVADLARAVNFQREKIIRAGTRPLWQPRTPRPSLPAEKTPTERPEVDTPALAAPTPFTSPVAGTVKAKRNSSPKLDPRSRLALMISLATVFLSVAIVFLVTSERRESRTEPVSTVTANSQWKLQERTVNGIAMMVVPPGCFMLNSDYFPNDPQNGKRCFENPFLIDKTEVTQVQFKQNNGVTDKGFTTYLGDRRPIVTITWFEADKYCRERRGARLPTEFEWEYAARGPDGLNYPWGTALDETKATWKRNENQGTANVGSASGDVSWVGALDMAGNVAEWVNSPFANDTGTPTQADNKLDLYVIRGGSWANFVEGDLLSKLRRPLARNTVAGDVGFRCVRDDG